MRLDDTITVCALMFAGTVGIQFVLGVTYIVIMLIG